MNDTFLQMIASQMGIPPTMLNELKASKPKLIDAEFAGNGLVTLVVEITQPNGQFKLLITLPLEQLQRFPSIYKQAAELAKGGDR
jgi:hypothetical protein